RLPHPLGRRRDGSGFWDQHHNLLTRGPSSDEAGRRQTSGPARSCRTRSGPSTALLTRSRAHRDRSARPLHAYRPGFTGIGIVAAARRLAAFATAAPWFAFGRAVVVG